MKIRLIALLLIVLQIGSTRVNGMIVNNLLTKEAAHNSIVSQVQQTQSEIAVWSTTGKDLDYIKNHYPENDIETTLLSFIQDAVNASYYYQSEIVEISLNPNSMEISPDQKLIKLNVTFTAKSDPGRVNDILQYMKQRPFYYPTNIKTHLNERRETVTSVSYDLWAKYTPTVQNAKSPIELVNNIYGFRDIIGKYTSRDEYRNMITGDGTSESGAGSGGSGGLNITIEGLDDNLGLGPSNGWGEQPIVDFNGIGNNGDTGLTPQPILPETPSQSVFETIKAKGLPFNGPVLVGFGPEHNGVKIQVPNATVVNPIHEGKVVFAANAPEIGNVVIIEHSQDTMTLYAHLSEISVKVGDQVNTQTKIGTTGKDSSGNSVLHYSLSHEGLFVNPQ